MIRAKYITIVVLIVAVVYLVATRDLSKGPAEVSRSSDASIAVLPFVVMATGDERIESLRSGPQKSDSAIRWNPA